MRSVQRIIKQKRNNLHLMKFMRKTAETKLTKKNKKKLKLAMLIIDELIPMVSGRNYRLQIITNKQIYNLYKQQVMLRGNKTLGTDIPLSFTTIRKNILKKWNIHRTTDATICPTCRYLEEYQATEAVPQSFITEVKLSAYKSWKKSHKNIPCPDSVFDKAIADAPIKWTRKYPKIKDHHERSKNQFKAYKQTKDRLAKGELEDTIMVLQDFTQLQPQSGFNQDLIISILSYDPTSTDKLHKSYHHFIAQDEKNDYYFVMAVWEHLLASSKLIPKQGKLKNIEIWSDGGGKHFKMTETMFYYSTIKERYNINLTYNFYESHHGHNICDAAAAHAKKIIDVTQRDKNKPAWTAEDLAEMINKAKKHSAIALREAAVPVTIKEKPTRLVGVKSFYKFEFLGDGKIKAYSSSLDSTYNKIYILKGVLDGLVEEEIIEEGNI